MPVRELDVREITEAVKAMCITANYDLPEDVYDALVKAKEAEESPVGREVLGQLVENADIAAADRVPICQDTGFAVIFAEVGQDVHFVGGSFDDAVNEGVRQGYGDGYLRKSVAEEPARARRNTKDNTPAILHTSIVPGDKVRLTMMAKGGGAENMSSLNMLKPSQGWAGMVDAVVETVSTTTLATPSQPCEGLSIARLLMFSAPPPLAISVRRTLSPGTMPVCRMAGVLSLVLRRACAGSSATDLRR